MFMENIITRISGLAAGENKAIYLVGGFLRDLYLGNPGHDLDFVVSGNALSFARKVAEILAGTYIPLDKINCVAKVVLEHGKEKWQIDFAALKGWNLEKDLSYRDFTINAMALELSQGLNFLRAEESRPNRKNSARRHWQQAIIDPYGGLADIENKLIRTISNYVFESDPVRILRGLRLAGKLNFSIRPETIKMMERDRWLLHEVAGERIWEELLGILAIPESYPWLATMDAIGVLFEILPVTEKMKITRQNNYHVDTVWVHTLKTYKFLEDMCLDLNTDGILTTSRGEELREKVLNHLDSKLPAGHRRIQLIKLAALLHDAGKVDTAKTLADGRITFPKHYLAGTVHAGEFARGLKISRSEELYLKKLVKNHMYPLYLFINQPVCPVSLHRFFKKLGPESTDLLLLSLADVTATYTSSGNERDLAMYRTFIGDFLNKYYFEPETFVNPPVLVKGTDLMDSLGIPPSKQLGDMLKKITEAQVRGEVTNRNEAISYARLLLKEKP